MEIYGNTTGLGPSAIKTLERIYRRKVPPSTIATAELVKSLCEASSETGRQVGALVHRSGQVDYVVVGDATKLMLPDIGRLRAAEGRFRALRLVHTHLRGEPLTDDDIVDLVRLRLDLVCAIQLAPDGVPRTVQYAYNAPSEPPYVTIGPAAMSALDVDVGELARSLETEFAKRSKARAVGSAKDGRAILVHVFEKGRSNTAEAEESMHELRELARTAGVDVVLSIVQGRPVIDAKYVMGKGKLNEIVLKAAELDAQVVILDRNLSPAQAAAIAKSTDLKVIDRSQLILDIFAQRAESSDGKLQVELAQLKYSMPRLQQKDDSLSRLTGGIGGRGPGETKLEIGRRRAKERLAHLEHQLKQLEKRRDVRRRKRRERTPTAAIVGYTNAGKSTLMNMLTNALPRDRVLAEDKLFATLDTRSRTVWLPASGHEIVLTDTVGFIRNLPKDLFAAFRATFEEAADADMLLHLVDASDPAKNHHMETTEKLLEELKLDRIPQLLVFNKIDLLEPFQLSLLKKVHPDAAFLSATQKDSAKTVLERLSQVVGRPAAEPHAPEEETTTPVEAS